MWWHCHKDEELVGTVFFEAEHGGFLSAFDDGTLGEVAPPEARQEEEDDEPLHPQAEDLFSIVRVSENRIAIKTAFGRYVSCDDAGSVSAHMEAMGTRELWQPIWKDQVNGAQGGGGGAGFMCVVPSARTRCLWSRRDDKVCDGCRAFASAPIGPSSYLLPLQEAGVLVLRSAGKGYLACEPEPGVKAKAEKTTQDDATMFRVSEMLCVCACVWVCVCVCMDV